MPADRVSALSQNVGWISVSMDSTRFARFETLMVWRKDCEYLSGLLVGVRKTALAMME
jgi:hypothetical protein